MYSRLWPRISLFPNIKLKRQLRARREREKKCETNIELKKTHTNIVYKESR